MAATIDIISGGRLELGIGAVWNEEESGAYGIELGSKKERSDRFEEACQVLIGGSGEKRTLLTTAKYAQHWNFVGGAPADFAHKRDVLFAHCAAIGRDPAEITMSSHIRLGADNDYAAVAGQVEALAAEGQASRLRAGLAQHL